MIGRCAFELVLHCDGKKWREVLNKKINFLQYLARRYNSVYHTQMLTSLFFCPLCKIKISGLFLDLSLMGFISRNQSRLANKGTYLYLYRKVFTNLPQLEINFIGTSNPQTIQCFTLGMFSVDLCLCVLDSHFIMVW